MSPAGGFKRETGGVLMTDPFVQCPGARHRGRSVAREGMSTSSTKTRDGGASLGSGSVAAAKEQAHGENAGHYDAHHVSDHTPGRPVRRKQGPRGVSAAAGSK